MWVCVFGDGSNFIRESPPIPWWCPYSGKVSHWFVTYMWSWLQAKDRGHDWAAGGLSVDKNGRPLPLWSPVYLNISWPPHLQALLSDLRSGSWLPFINSTARGVSVDLMPPISEAHLREPLPHPGPFGTRHIWKTISLNASNNYSNYR